MALSNKTEIDTGNGSPVVSDSENTTVIQEIHNHHGITLEQYEAGLKESHLLAELHIDLENPEKTKEKIKKSISEGTVKKEELELLVQE